MSSVAMDMETVERRLRRARVVPVVRVGDADSARELIDRILEAGLDVVELTTTIPGWEAVAAALRSEHRDLAVGIGTVTSSEQAAQAIEIGAHFCVSPRLAPHARTALDTAGIPFIEGGLTPTELLDAASRGVAKLFPAHVGGVQYLKSLLAVAPDARIMPTGGIPLDEVSAWLHAGAIAVGVGSDLTAPGDIASRVEGALSR
jgi:2-dehydro-3-deoxyphosphogluconate aldolase / (4S)-4-hydroxy-2-oxoglutarate aldolase